MGKKRRGGKQTQPPGVVTTPTDTATAGDAAGSSMPEGPVDPAVLASVLEADFPLIDSSLILAIVSDFDAATLGSHVSAIRDQLGELQAHSVPDGDAGGSGGEVGTWATSTKTATSDASSKASRPLASTEPTSLDADGRDPELDENGASGPGSEAELLAVFFPNLRSKDIADALAAEPSLEAAIDHLLSIELIRGVQRTGVWADEDPPPDGERDRDWGPVTRRRSSASSNGATTSASSTAPAPSKIAPPKTQPGKKGKKKTVTLPLVDTLQRRAASPAPSRTPTSGSGASTPSSAPATGDVWSAFASLAAYLGDTTRTPPAYFTSYLHSPEYGCAHEAVHAALAHLASTRSTAPQPEVLAILENMYGTGNGDDDADAAVRAAVGAADGDVSVTMDLMDVLADLTEWPDYVAARADERDPWAVLDELESGRQSRSRGPSSRVSSSAASSRPGTPASATPSSAAPSSATPSSPATTAAPTRALNSNRLKRPETAHKGTAPTPSLVRAAKSAVPGSTAVTTHAHAHEANLPSSAQWAEAGTETVARPSVDWKTVAPRQRRAAHPLAASIPAYARDPGVGASVGRYGHAKGDGGDSYNSPPGGLSSRECFDRGEREWDRRRAAMMAASAHFRRGGGGGRKDLAALVAGHYAAQARDAGASARAWQLRGARIDTDAQLATGQIDLHHRTVEQARALALDAASKWHNTATTAVAPLVIVTGKGLHSAGEPVLGPAVARVLRDEGWRVDERPGYVAVRGR